MSLVVGTHAFLATGANPTALCSTMSLRLRGPPSQGRPSRSSLPWENALRCQKDLGITQGNSIVLPHVRLEVDSEKGKQVPATINCGVLLLILLECIRGFVSEQGGVVFDMFKELSALRGVCRAFYLTMLDAWPLLQKEFFKQLHKWLVSHPVEPRHNDMRLRSSNSAGFWKLRTILDAVDPRVSRRPDGGVDHHAVAKIGISFFHEVLTVHLRYHCVPYLIMLWWNDQVIQKNFIKDVDGIPSLCGFATYLDESFGHTIATGLADRNAVIMMFYEGDEVPVWNMLPDKTGSKNLESYLYGTALKRVARKRKLVMGEVLCAPAALFEGKWPRSSAVGSLKHYALNRDEEEEDEEDLEDEAPAPPIRFANCPEYKLIVEIILPMRLLLYKSVENGIATWKPRHDCYTMTITTGMLTTASQLDGMPDNFEIMDQHGTCLNRLDTAGVPNFLVPGVPLEDDLFKLWAEVLLTTSANASHSFFQDPSFRAQMNDLPIFRNFVMVEKSVKQLLDCSLHYDDYIDGYRRINDQWAKVWETSPLHDDWGDTDISPNGFVDPDAALLEQFTDITQVSKDHVELPRCQWASSTFFLLDVERSYSETTSDPGKSLYNAYVRPNSIPSLMKHVTKQARLDWSRHKFTGCEKVMKGLKKALCEQTQCEVQASGKKRVIMVNTDDDIKQLFGPGPFARVAPAPVASTGRVQTQTRVTDDDDIASLFSH